jgi:hypothetical protein
MAYAAWAGMTACTAVWIGWNPALSSDRIGLW